MAWYTHRDTLKVGLGLAGSATAAHSALDAVLEGVAREIDRYTGFGFAPTSAARYYTPRDTDCLYLDQPLTAVDSIALDTDGNASYDATMSATCWYGAPYNASAEQPPRPWWELEVANNSSLQFPKGVQRGACITGTWGYYNLTTSIPSVTLSTGLASGSTAMEVSNSSMLHPGQMILLESERIIIAGNGKSGSDTATSSGRVSITRAQAGTAAVAHTSGLSVAAYKFPVVDKASLFQAEMDYRAQDAPLGFTGGDGFGGQQSVAPGGGSLHPFTRRTLDQFRRPVAQ